MKATASAKSNRRGFKPAIKLEALESRTLLSAYGTADTFQLATGTGAIARTYCMASDNAGNVYAAGTATDSAGVWHGIIREETNGVWSTVEDVPNMTFWSIKTDGAGDVFAVGDSAVVNDWSDTPKGNSWTVAVRPVGNSAFTLVNDSPTANSVLGQEGITLDGSGNVFISGTAAEKVKGYTYNDSIVRKEPVSKLLAGQSVFTTVDDFNYYRTYGAGQGSTLTSSAGITSVGSGPGAGLYVVGYNGMTWFVRKSTNGGSSWTTVDRFAYSTIANNVMLANAIAADASGNLYYCGMAEDTTSNQQFHWVVRKGTNGGTSWSTSDDFDQAPGTVLASRAWSVCTDRSGNVYVAGIGNTPGVRHALVRTLVGGVWQTVDDFVSTQDGTVPSSGTAPGGADYSLTQDSLGNVFIGGGAAGLYTSSTAYGPSVIRSLPAAPANLTAAAVSASQINLAWANLAGGDVSGFAVWRSTDGISFTLVTTVGAGVTSFSDTGLSSGTTFYYYVTAVLNSVDGTAAGSSGASNTASASL